MFYFKLFTGIIILYIVVIGVSFMSEVTYNKRSVHDVKQDWKQIVIRTSLIFSVFLVASFIWSHFNTH